MSGLLSWFSGKNKANPYTLRDMRYRFIFIIYGYSDKFAIIIRNRSVTNSNQSTIIEALRSLAEIMIYGDKNSEAFFEYNNEWRFI